MWGSSWDRLMFITSTFSICTICATLDRRLQNEIDLSKRLEIIELREDHKKRQMQERIYYYSKRDESKKNPKQYLSLIIDGMDQSKSNLPHIIGRRPKNVNPADLLKTHITGVISHGHNRFTTYLDFNQYPHDPNLTLNILLKVLLTTAQKKNNQLPPVLYLQADNCFRENKNRFVLAFCELLVIEKIFDEVHLSFLIVGHTHEDVDALFSKISQKLKKNDAETIPHLKELLPDPTDLENMLDIKTWLQPSLSVVKKHTGPHHYRFSRQNGDVVRHYKSHQDKDWEKLDCSFFSWLPKRKPSILQPNYENIDIEKLSKQIDAMKCMFKDEIPTIRWWNRFLETLKQTKRRNTGIKFLESLPRQKEREDRNQPESVVPSEVERMIENEVSSQRVIIKKTTKKPVGQRNNNNRRNSQKCTGRKRKYIMIVEVTKKMNIVYDKDEKKHVWYFLWHMWCCEIVLTAYLLTLLFWLYIWYMQIYDGLIMLIQFLQYLWMHIFIIHMGHSAAACNIETGLGLLVIT